MAGKGTRTRTMRKAAMPSMTDLSSLNMESLVCKIKETAAACPDPEEGKIIKRQMHALLKSKLKELEDLCEAEEEKSLSDMRQVRRNIPSAISNLTIGQIRDAGGDFGPDEKGNIVFHIPSCLYKSSSSGSGGVGGNSSVSANEKRMHKSAVASAKKMIIAAKANESASGKRMSKRTRTFNPLTPSASGLKVKVQKLTHNHHQQTGIPAATTAIRPSERVTRSIAKGTASKTRLASRAANTAIIPTTANAQQQPQQQQQSLALAVAKERERAELKKRETEFVDALADFSLHENNEEKNKSKNKKSTEEEVTGDDDSIQELENMQVKMSDMSIANPHTPTGRHRILAKDPRPVHDKEPVITLHVSKDGTPLILRK